MKNSILILGLLLSFQSLKSQSYIPMIEDSMIVVNAINGYSHYGFRKYKYIGDTTINSIQYYKCYSDTNLRDSSFLITPTMKYYGAIREINKKIYFLKKDSTVERKIYDFSLNINDTTKIFYSEMYLSKNYNIKLFKIENSTLFFGRKVYSYNSMPPPGGIILVSAEGYGNIMFSSNEIEVDYPTKKYCVTKKNNSAFNIPLNYSKCYQQIVNSFIFVKELSIEKQISLFPNPANNKITIISDKEHITSISLMDIKGQKIIGFQVNSLKKELDISFLDNGIYLLQIKTEKGVVVKKLVKK